MIMIVIWALAMFIGFPTYLAYKIAQFRKMEREQE